MSGAFRPCCLNTTESVFNKDDNVTAMRFRENIVNVFGSDNNDDLDLWHLVKKEDVATLKLLQLFGLEDQLIEVNRSFANYMKNERKHTDFTYKETTGGHNWFYWNRALVDLLDFLGYPTNSEEKIIL